MKNSEKRTNRKRRSKHIKVFSVQDRKLNKKMNWSLGGISDQAAS